MREISSCRSAYQRVLLAAVRVSRSGIAKPWRIRCQRSMLESEAGSGCRRAESAGCSEDSFLSRVPSGSGEAVLLAAVPARVAATDSDPLAEPAFWAAAIGTKAARSSADEMR